MTVIDDQAVTVPKLVVKRFQYLINKIGQQIAEVLMLNANKTWVK